MIRTGFRYGRPDTIEDAVRLLAAADGRGCVLGGGSVLIPALSAGHMDPELILDLARLRLNQISDRGDVIAIGAGVTYAELEASAIVRERLPLLAAMVVEVTGGPGLWNLATLGGSACRANPASDGPGCLVALNARFRLVSVRGSRDVPASCFFQGAYETDRAADEIMTEIAVPAASGAGPVAHLKLKHAASSWPIVTASCLRVAEGRIRLSLGGVAPVPVAMEWSGDCPIDEGRVSAMAQQAAAAIRTEWTDELAGPGYRRSVAGTMAARAIRQVTGLAP